MGQRALSQQQKSWRINEAPLKKGTLPLNQQYIQLKAGCACGGQCPNCRDEGLSLQPKLHVNQPNDRFEREADRVAGQVMNNQQSTHTITPTPPNTHTLSRKSESTPEVDNATASEINSLRGQGQPMPASERAFFEPRFGADFSGVRIHTGGKAASTAQAINARAYTMGNDVVFGPGQYAPGTTTGRSLMAHELTHTLQQRSVSGTNNIQRMSYAESTDTPERASWQAHGFTLVPIPQEDRESINEAINIVRDVVNDPDHDCHNFFKEKCPGGSTHSLKNAFDRAQLWLLTNPSGNELARGEEGGHEIALTKKSINRSTRLIARTLIHEMMHLCGITSGEDHPLADEAEAVCIGSSIQESGLGLSGGFSLGGMNPILMFTYRRILTSWVDGHIGLTAGGDFNILGTAMGSVSLNNPHFAEFGSASIGLTGRTTPFWHGSEIIGFSGDVDVGFGVGNFEITPTSPEGPPQAQIAPSFMLQIGGGPRFYIPSGDMAIPLSLEAAWRMAQPLNADAERIHSLIFSISLGGF